MNKDSYETLSQAVNALTKSGYDEGFKAEDDKLIGNVHGREYHPHELNIVATYRFEGSTDPQDDAIVFAIEANDGIKGTLVMSYSAEHNQNVELIKKIPRQEC